MQKGAVVNDLRGATVLSVLGGLLFPITLAFVLFSTPRSRRQPIFWIQLIALLLAMSQASVEVASYHIDVLTSGAHPQLFFNLCAARESLKWIVPWLTDCALVFKILYFYPRTLFSRNKQFGMVAFPALIKVPRLVVITINLVIMCRAFATQQTTWAAGLKFQVAEIAMQVADNSYCSLILLYKSWAFFHASSSTVSRTARAQRRARHIIESIAMSFLPALCIQIAFLVVQAIPGDNAYRLVQAQNYLFIFNVYISLTFSILATSWSSICNIHEWHRLSAARSSHNPSSLGSGGFNSDGSRRATRAKGSGSVEKQLPEHRTLLQYLTINDESVEELSSMSSDDQSARDEKAGVEYGESMDSTRSITYPRRSPSAFDHQGSGRSTFGGLVMHQKRERATSPRAGLPSPTSKVDHKMQLDKDGMADLTRVAHFQSPRTSPFALQNPDGSSEESFRLDDGHSGPDIRIEQEDRLSLEDMLRQDRE